MVCKKSSSSSADVSTSIGASVLDNIGVHYGENVKKELIAVEVGDTNLGVKAKGWFSNANYGGKKGTFLFFINRLSFVVSLILDGLLLIFIHLIRSSCGLHSP